MPLQTVSMIENPVVFIWEDNQATRNIKSIALEVVKGILAFRRTKCNSLLQGMEGSDALRIRKTVVFTSVNDQLRGRPLMYKVRRAESIPSMQLVKHPFTHETGEQLLFSRFSPLLLPWTPKFVIKLSYMYKCKIPPNIISLYSRRITHLWRSHCTRSRRPVNGVNVVKRTRYDLLTYTIMTE